MVKVKGVRGILEFILKFKTNFPKISKRASLFHWIWREKWTLFSLIWAKKYMYFPKSWQTLVTVKFKSTPYQISTTPNGKSSVIHYESDHLSVLQMHQTHATVKNLGITKLVKTRKSRTFVSDNSKKGNHKW